MPFLKITRHEVFRAFLPSFRSCSQSFSCPSRSPALSQRRTLHPGAAPDWPLSRLSWLTAKPRAGPSLAEKPSNQKGSETCYQGSGAKVMKVHPHPPIQGETLQSCSNQELDSAGLRLGKPGLHFQPLPSFQAVVLSSSLPPGVQFPECKMKTQACLPGQFRFAQIFEDTSNDYRSAKHVLRTRTPVSPSGCPRTIQQ